MGAIAEHLGVSWSQMSLSDGPPMAGHNNEQAASCKLSPVNEMIRQFVGPMGIWATFSLNKSRVWRDLA